MDEKQSHQTYDKGLPYAQSMDRLSSATTLQLGRSIQSGYHRFREQRPDSENVAGNPYTIKTYERVFSAFPQKKPTTAKDKKAEEERKKKEAEELAAQKLIPKNETNEEALSHASGWQNSVQISKKFSVGTLASSKYKEKTEVLEKVYKKYELKSSILPLSNYYGPKPDPDKDPFNRRKVEQLNDIQFTDDSEDDFEDVRDIKRQRKTILTEENLKKMLSEETTKLNIEHHHWLKEGFLSKIG